MSVLLTDFSTYPELNSASEVAALSHGHIVGSIEPVDVAELVALLERAELKNKIFNQIFSNNLLVQ